MNRTMRSRLEAVETRYAHRAAPHLSKAERDQSVCEALATPGLVEGWIAELTGPDAMRDRAVLQAATRADA